MRVIQVEAFGGPEAMVAREAPDPEPPVDGYVVRVVAAGVNYADVVTRRGRYQRNQPLPQLLGKEAAGVVVARGPSATRFDIGDPVCLVRFGNGCYADLVAVDGHEVLPAPRGLTFAELAAFPINFATAWFCMHELARVRPGEAILVNAAAGGVGTAAIQLGISGGCGPVIGTAGSEAKCELVRSLGADACIDYSRADLRPVVRLLTDGQGVGYCLESVGGEVYRQSLEVMGPLGHLVVIGFSSISTDYATAIDRLHPLTVFQRSFSVGGFNLDNVAFQRCTDVWARLVRHVEEHGLRPVVGRTLPLDEVATAHHELETRATTGKVVLVVDPAQADDIPLPPSRSEAPAIDLVLADR